MSRKSGQAPRGLKVHDHTSWLWGRSRGRWCALVLSVMLLAAGPLWSKPSQPSLRLGPLTEADQILSFADTLFEAGDYFCAITEYKRFLFLYPAHPRAGWVQLQIGLAYLRGQQWEDARRTFQAIAQRHPNAVAAGNEAAGLLFLFEAAGYASAVYGAINAAHRWNRDQEDRWLHGLELQHGPALRSLSQRRRTFVLVRIPF